MAFRVTRGDTVLLEEQAFRSVLVETEILVNAGALRVISSWIVILKNLISGLRLFKGRIFLSPVGI